MAKGATFNMEMMTKMFSAKDMAATKLIELAEENPDIYFICCDVSPKGGKADEFRKLHPDRFLDVGIAEPNAIGISCGLALNGKLPFVQAFGPFLSLRCVDQIHTDIAYNDVPVRIIGSHGGVTSGGGPTHYTIADFAIIRAIPNMTLIVPSDAHQAAKVIEASMTWPGPIYIRVARANEPLVYDNPEYEYRIGKAITTREGTDATVIGCGIGVFLGKSASELLEKEGIALRVIDMHTLSPIDKDAVLAAARETGVIVTVEDHNVTGGLGDAVASVLAEAGVGIRFKRLGLPSDRFPALGNPEELYAHYGFDPPGIANEIKRMLEQ